MEQQKPLVPRKYLLTFGLAFLETTANTPHQLWQVRLLP